VTHAGAEFWDQFFRRRLESGHDPVQILRRETGEPYKHVWRGIARR
jgi:hypothetical protein